MNDFGNKKICEMGLKKARFSPLPSPRVKSSLRNKSVSGEGDFRDENRPLGVCPIFDVHVHMGDVLMASIRSQGSVNTEMKT